MLIAELPITSSVKAVQYTWELRQRSTKTVVGSKCMCLLSRACERKETSLSARTTPSKLNSNQQTQNTYIASNHTRSIHKILQLHLIPNHSHIIFTRNIPNTNYFSHHIYLFLVWSTSPPCTHYSTAIYLPDQPIICYVLQDHTILKGFHPSAFLMTSSFSSFILTILLIPTTLHKLSISTAPTFEPS